MSEQPFVGYSPDPIEGNKLRDWIKEYTAPENTYFFVRWPHQVSGIVTECPEHFPGQSGHLFNAQWELRWRQRPGGKYELLLLSIKGPDPKFHPVGSEVDDYWAVQSQPAHLYEKIFPRFPRGFQYPEGLKVQQRQFIDKQTATVQFIALTVEGS